MVSRRLRDRDVLRWRPTRAKGWPAIAGVGFVAALFLQERIDNGPDYLFIVLLFGGTWLLGRASRLWRTRVSHAEQHQRDLARLAVAEERVRIARELHDSVAHSLSVIAVQSDAAEAALAHDPDRAREPLRAINASARGSLHEIRDMLHLLRTDDVNTVDVRTVDGEHAAGTRARRARHASGDRSPPGGARDRVGPGRCG